MVYAGTSWEGVHWKVKDQNEARFELRITRRMATMLVAALMPILAMSTMLLTSSPAQAHVGVSCSARAYAPYAVGYYDIGGHGAGFCNLGGYNHYVGVQVWKNINNYPDRWIAENGYWSSRIETHVYSRGASRGGGTYYAIAWVRYHDSARGPNYYR